MSTADEFRSLMRVLKKMTICVLSGSLTVHKLLLIVTVTRNRSDFVKIAPYVIYLSIIGVALLLPLFYLAPAVRGHNLFLTLAAGLLVLQGAEFFLFLIGSPPGEWIIGQLVILFILSIILGLAESLYREKDRRQREEEQRLSQTVRYYNVELTSETIGEDSDEEPEPRFPVSFERNRCPHSNRSI